MEDRFLLRTPQNFRDTEDLAQFMKKNTLAVNFSSPPSLVLLDYFTISPSREP
ncbi:hypothetical protein DCAR_0935329 [Daucus carota subsp. sativus]|uniref:Uncharacterized protein n=1 Tax=Daucus carota subsp. sativus TaxID=79200 RepID=A0A175YI03_DAUCS|nr:hypothetical protein DCAR_0935329 [Daucus carota subsp. sativus]